MTCPILIFLKAPVKGRVKTRLAESTGDDMALALYRAFVGDVLETAGSAGEVLLFHTPENGQGDIRDLVGPEYRMFVQKGMDLGEKMACAFEQVFAMGADRVVLMGTDVPDVPVFLIREAMESLTNHGSVIGPVADGGYFLIGFKSSAFTRNVFEHIPWSTGRVFEKTLERMGANQIECHVLKTWYDVDTEADLKALIHRLSSGQTRAPRTQACMEIHGTDHFDNHTGRQ